jgi:hypothetical protein
MTLGGLLIEVKERRFLIITPEFRKNLVVKYLRVAAWLKFVKPTLKSVMQLRVMTGAQKNDAQRF